MKRSLPKPLSPNEWENDYVSTNDNRGHFDFNKKINFIFSFPPSVPHSLNDECKRKPGSFRAAVCGEDFPFPPAAKWRCRAVSGWGGRRIASNSRNSHIYKGDVI
jgi:hypothetical protein